MKKLALLASMTAAVLAMTVGANAADVTVGQSGWNWGNPQPQGNTLRTVEFAGGRGYAAGDFGTLLRTDDGGRSWTGLPTGITANLARIRAVDQNTVIIGSGCILRRSDDGGTTFKRLPFTTETGCPATVSSLSFPSPQTGYLLLSDGTVVQTANGGTSFSGRQAVPGTEATKPAGPPSAPTDILFTDANTGFATTRDPGGGTVYRTTDGGNTWFPRTTAPRGLNGLYFPDPSIGYAVGDGNTVLKTTDGGETWDPKPVAEDVPANDLTSIRCTNTVTCLISTAGGERVLRTTDGGTTITSFNPSTRRIFAVAFASSSSAVGVGERGATVLSTNADTATPSFVPVGDQPLTGSYNRMRATSGALVYAPGDNGKLVRSNDGGHHWSTLQVPTSEDLLDAWFVDESVGYAIDVSGKAQRTEDGGSSWAPLDTGTPDRPNAVYAVDRNVVLLFGPRGLRRSEDRGDTFAKVDGKAVRNAALGDYDRTDGVALFAYANQVLVVSEDRGATWKRIKAPMRNAQYAKVDFVTRSAGWALLADGRMFRTVNGGRTWKELRAVGTEGVIDMAFGDARNGMLAVRSFGNATGGGGALGSPPDFTPPTFGWVLRTSDAGATWRPQLIGPAPIASRGLAMPAATTAFSLASPSDLFYTNTGGDAGPETAVTLSAKTRKVKKTQRVKLTGTLTPTVARASIVVSARNPKTNVWRVVDTPSVSSTGTFTSSIRVGTTTQLVAQWRGDADHNGDGSPAITITKVKAKKKRKR